MVIEFEPVRRGTTALQAVVPVAVPEPPKLLAQVTAVTPVLSLAVPLIRMEASAVENVVAPGEVIARAGGVVSAVLGGFTGGVARRVTGKDCESWLVPSGAAIVMVLAPTASGTPGMIQAEAGPVAAPEVAPVDQVTAMVPEPPEAEPDMLIADTDVVDGGAVTVSVRGAAGFGGGVGLGGGRGVGLGGGVGV